MNRKVRDSNIELLRIIAMFMIVMSHLVGHGILQDYIKSNNGLIWRNGSIVNKISSSLMFPGGSIGANIFFLITGFYLIKDNGIRLKKICFEVIFYAIFLFSISIGLKFLGYTFPGINKDTFLINLARSLFIPISSGMWWFVTTYVVLILVHPLINNYIKNMGGGRR